MEDTAKTFASLVSDAPLYKKPSTITITGALARTSEEGKFALVQADGSALTLDSSAVNSHAVIGTSLGQSIVQVELDADKAPQEALDYARATPQIAGHLTGLVGWDYAPVRGPVAQVATPTEASAQQSPSFNPNSLYGTAPISWEGTGASTDHYHPWSVGLGSAVPSLAAQPESLSKSDAPHASYFSGWPRGWDYTPRPVLQAVPQQALPQVISSPYLDHPQTYPYADGYHRATAGAGVGDAPFSLATPHQICADLLSYMESLTQAT